MSYPQIVRAYQPCSTCTSSCWPSQAPTTITPKVMRFMAVFSENWNWPFSSKSHRSRRRRFANSGERISGFTAIFNDDWRDHEGESEVPIRFERSICSESCHSLQWEKSLKRRTSAEHYTEPSNAVKVPWKRKCEERTYPPKTTSLAPFTFTYPQEDQVEFSELESWPCTPATTESLTEASIASTNSEKAFTLGPAVRQNPLSSLSGPIHLIDNDITMQSETKRDIYLYRTPKIRGSSPVHYKI